MWGRAWLGDKHLTKSAPKQVDAVGNHFLVTFHVLGARRVYVAICQSLVWKQAGRHEVELVKDFLQNCAADLPTLHKGGGGVAVEVLDVVGTTSVFVQRKEICFVAV